MQNSHVDAESADGSSSQRQKIRFLESNLEELGKAHQQVRGGRLRLQQQLHLLLLHSC